MNINEIEAQAKALAPVFSRLLEKTVAKMQSELEKRDARIAELENSKPLILDYGVIAKAAADLIPTPKNGDSVSEDAVKDAVAASFERRFSDMQLSWERQARETFEKAIDKMPTLRDGIDALPIEDIEITQDGRNVTLKLGNIERTLKLDSIIDRGVWSVGEYEKGDAVTYGGSLWIAQKESPEGAPGTNKEQWRLAVKKGRDGKDLRDTASSRGDNDAVAV